MKQSSTIFLKIALFLMGAPVLALGIFGLFYLANNAVNPDYSYILYPPVSIMYLSVIPYFLTLYQAFRLLIYIDKNKAFSNISVIALKKIKYFAIVISGLYVIMMPFVFWVADKDDAPGLIIVGMVPIFASLVIAVFATVLKRLLQQAIDIKLENDYTV
ncbi:DUF2975 domain-containing protein [Priestia flexa]|uniref:DUF2975 domain-containing protein n=1 Tax=Priestia flexa TaxID=86664 RepID=UPI00203F08C6|nr:DUF2975 domain-containing protein [Priestia flexa]MCM3068448.1 DUF2975 domain-containing protein [Priestia flexa]